MRSRKFTALIVDDEEPARARLAELLSRDDDITHLSFATNGVDAVELIQSSHPDMVFLDVQMPGLDGFGVIGAITPENMPSIIFVTAYDKFALNAFEASAVDYLLKPFSDERFRQAIERVKVKIFCAFGATEISRTSSPNRFLEFAYSRSMSGQNLKYIAIREPGKIRLLDTDDIQRVEAAGIYVNLFTKSEVILYRSSISVFFERLDPGKFIRTHKSHIVSVRHIDFFEKRSHGEFEIAMLGGARVPLSRTFKSAVEEALGQPL